MLFANFGVNFGGVNGRVNPAFTMNSRPLARSLKARPNILSLRPSSGSPFLFPKFCLLACSIPLHRPLRPDLAWSGSAALPPKPPCTPGRLFCFAPAFPKTPGPPRVFSVALPFFGRSRVSYQVSVKPFRGVDENFRVVEGFFAYFQNRLAWHPAQGLLGRP